MANAATLRRTLEALLVFGALKSTDEIARVRRALAVRRSRSYRSALLAVAPTLNAGQLRAVVTVLQGA